MIKKLFFTFVLLLSFNLSVFAENIQYKNINEGDLICYSEASGWFIANKKAQEYFTKKISDGRGSFSEFYSPSGEFLFSTGSQYEFILKGRLIGYSNPELKFYEYTMDNGILNQRELGEEEITELFPEFKILKISEFTKSTNSMKLKKDKKHYKIILLNDTDRYFYHYAFTSNNAKYDTYPLKGFLDVTKSGMIQFSRFGDNSKNNPWFVLLVR